MIFVIIIRTFYEDALHEQQSSLIPFAGQHSPVNPSFAHFGCASQVPPDEVVVFSVIGTLVAMFS